MRFLAFLASVAAFALLARADESAATPNPAPAAPSAAASPSASAASPADDATTPPALAAHPPPAPAHTAEEKPAPEPAAQPSPAPKHQTTVAEIRARLLEHLRRKTEDEKTGAPKEPKAAASTKADAKSTPAKTTAKNATEPAQFLPKYEIKQMPINELDLKLAKEDREIAQEKKNAEPTPLDDTLNGKKVSHWFSFLGGQSSDQRASVANERVYIMEQEKDLIEAIADAQTKDEKAELEKALADLRKTRRELEQSLR